MSSNVLQSLHLSVKLLLLQTATSLTLALALHGSFQLHVLRRLILLWHGRMGVNTSL